MRLLGLATRRREVILPEDITGIRQRRNAIGRSVGMVGEGPRSGWCLARAKEKRPGEVAEPLSIGVNFERSSHILVTDIDLGLRPLFRGRQTFKALEQLLFGHA